MHRHRARIRHGAVCRNLAGAAWRSVASQPSGRERDNTRDDQTAESRRVLLRRGRLEGHGLRASTRRCAAGVASNGGLAPMNDTTASTPPLPTPVSVRGPFSLAWDSDLAYSFR